MPDILDSELQGLTLQSYITDAQRLLHDSTYRFWSQAELTDYAHKARKKIAAETGCNAQIVRSWTLDSGINEIPTINIIPGRRVIGLLDIYCWYSENFRPALRYFPYSIFSRSAVVTYNYQGPPEMWSQRGGLVFIARRPGQDYTLDFDASVEPTPLSALDDPDYEITSPFSDLVAPIMAFWAKMKDQKREEANAFMADYYRERNTVIASTNIRKLVGR
jgi:hypothetical protein